jgi:hypothetical protein
MREKRKDGLFTYGFLLDRDVSKAVSLFPRKRTKTIADIGLPQDAADAEIIKAANGFKRTISGLRANLDSLGAKVDFGAVTLFSDRIVALTRAVESKPPEILGQYIGGHS